MSCLITGAGGYLGAHLASELARQGVPCLAPSHREFDLTDATGMERYCSDREIDRVIHLAGAVETTDASRLYTVNIAGLYSLLRVCAAHGVQHFTFASSNVVYCGEGVSAQGVQALCAPNPENLYAVSKYAGELLVADFCAARSIGWANVRIADIYGPGQKTGNLLRAVANSAAAGEPLKLYGAGARKRDYIYVTDVARGLAFISARAMTGAVNLGTGVGTSVAELVALAAELSGGASTILPISVEREDVSQIWLDVEPLRAAGFQTEISLREGLKKCIEKKRKA